MRRIAYLVPLMVATLTAAACTAPSREDNNAGTPDPDTALGVTLEPNATIPAPAIPGARRGGTVTAMVAWSHSKFEPASSYVNDRNEILKLTNRTLTVFTERDGRSVLMPDLATDLGHVSPDGLTWTFRLKDGLRYEDGSPIKAADVAYDVARSFAHDEYPAGPTYQDTYLAGGDTYKGPYHSKGAFPGVSAPDDHTVVFHLRRVFPDLPYFASFPLFSPVPQGR
jgi:peptide/nickel transport system substrate-binding protein